MSKYDLEERTAKYGEMVIDCCRSMRWDIVNRPLISQIIRSSTSVGANYYEANNASSLKDFRNKVYICKKEANETRHFSRMLARSNPEKKEDLRKIYKEALELARIFQTMINKVSKKI